MGRKFYLLLFYAVFASFYVQDVSGTFGIMKDIIHGLNPLNFMRDTRNALLDIILALKQKNGGVIPPEVSSLFVSGVNPGQQQPNIVYMYPANCICPVVPGSPNRPSTGIIPPERGPPGTFRPLPPNGNTIPEIPGPKSPEEYGCINTNPGPFPGTGSNMVAIPGGIVIIDPETGRAYWQEEDGHRTLIGDDGKVVFDDPNKPTNPNYPGYPNNPNDPHNPNYPGNPNDPNNPQFPGNPNDPNSPNYPGNPNDPNNPKYPGNPNDPNNPYYPGNPNDPNNPKYPGNPNDPNNPYYPGNPNDPNNPSYPGDPNDPNNPNYPGNPNDPNNPNYPGNPNNPNNPDRRSIVKVSRGTFETDPYGNRFWIDETGKVFWVGPDGFILTVPFIHIPGKFYQYSDTKDRFWIDKDGVAYIIDQDGNVNGNPSDPEVKNGKFITDELGRQWWIDNKTGQKYFIDENGNILTVKYKGEDGGYASIFPGKLWIDGNKNRLWIDFDSNQLYFIDPKTNRISQGRGTMKVEKGKFITDDKGRTWWKSDLTGNKYFIDGNGNILSTYNKDPNEIPPPALIWVDDNRRLCIIEKNRTVQILEKNHAGIKIETDSKDSSILTTDGHVVVSSDGKMYLILNDNARFTVQPNGKITIEEYCHGEYPQLKEVLKGHFTVDAAGYVYWVSPNGYYLLLNNYGFVTNTVVLFPGRLYIDYEGKWTWLAYDGKVYPIRDEQVQGLPELEDYFFRFDPKIGYYALSHGQKYSITKTGFVISRKVKDMEELLALPPISQPSTPPPNSEPRNACPTPTSPTDSRKSTTNRPPVLLPPITQPTTPQPDASNQCPAGHSLVMMNGRNTCLPSHVPDGPSTLPSLTGGEGGCPPGHVTSWLNGQSVCVPYGDVSTEYLLPDPNSPDGRSCPPGYVITLVDGQNVCVPIGQTTPDFRNPPKKPAKEISCPLGHIRSWLNGQNVCIPLTGISTEDPTATEQERCPPGFLYTPQLGKGSCSPSKHPTRKPEKISCPPSDVMSWLNDKTVCIPLHLIPTESPDTSLVQTPAPPSTESSQDRHMRMTCPDGYLAAMLNGRRACKPLPRYPVDTPHKSRTRIPITYPDSECPVGFMTTFINGKHTCLPSDSPSSDDPGNGMTPIPGPYPDLPKYPTYKPTGGLKIVGGLVGGGKQSKPCSCANKPGWDCVCYNDGGHWVAGAIGFSGGIDFRKLKGAGNKADVNAENSTTPEPKKP